MVELPKSVEDDQQTPRIRRGRVDSVDLYEIKDSELDLLERGMPDLQLNFAIFLLTLAVTAVSSLTTASFENPLVRTVFVVAAVVGVLGGAFLLLAWYGSYTSHRDVCRRIRERMPTNGGSETPDPPDEDVTPS